MPHDETLVGRVHLAASLALWTWGLSALTQNPVTGATLLHAFPLLVLGGVTVLVMGTTRMLLAGILGLRIPHALGLPWIPGAAATVGAVLLYEGPATTRVAAATLWAGALLLHVLVVSSAVWPALLAGNRSLAFAGRDPRRTVPLFLVGFAYALASAVIVPISYAGDVSRPAMLHIVLVGFVATTIVAAGLQILPRFTGVGIPAPAKAAIGVLVATGPALIAWGIETGNDALAWGAVAQALGLGGFALATLAMLATSGRPRPSHFAYAAASLSVLVGLGLGVAFAFDPAQRVWANVHGTLNLVGFVGLFILAASVDLYAPALRPDVRWTLMQSRLVLTAGTFAVLLAAVAVAWDPLRGRHAFWAVALLFGVQAASAIAGLTRRRPGR